MERDNNKLIHEFIAGVLYNHTLSLADEADSCIDCNKVHEYRPIRFDKNGTAVQMTWVSPDDNHVYVRKCHPETGDFLRDKANEIKDKYN